MSLKEVMNKKVKTIFMDILEDGYNDFYDAFEDALTDLDLMADIYEIDLLYDELENLYNTDKMDECNKLEQLLGIYKKLKKLDKKNKGSN